MEKLTIVESVGNFTLYTWDGKTFQVDVQETSFNSLCIFAGEAEKAAKVFWKKVADAILCEFPNLAEKARKLLSLANNEAAFAGEAKNATLAALRILKKEW